MVGLNLTPGRTELFERTTGHNIARSHVGMAHFAGTGPKGKTCKSCDFFSYDKNAPAKDQPCGKYYQLATGKKSKSKIPHNAAACKYYEARK